MNKMQMLKEVLDKSGLSYTPGTGKSFVVFPKSQEQAAGAMSLSKKFSVNTLPCGYYSDPWNEEITFSRDTLLISSRYLDSECLISPAEGSVTLSPGTTVKKLSDEYNRHNSIFPFIYGVKNSRTAGDLFSGGGYNLFDGICGTFNDIVTGIEFIDTNGDILKFGGRIMKNVTGFDIPSFMGHCTGRYGFITKLNLKFNPFPPETILLSFKKIKTPGLLEIIAILHKQNILYGFTYFPDRKGKWTLKLPLFFFDPETVRIFKKSISRLNNCQEFSEETDNTDSGEFFTDYDYIVNLPGNSISMDIKIHGQLEWDIVNRIFEAVTEMNGSPAYGITGCQGAFHIICNISFRDSNGSNNYNRLIKNLSVLINDFYGKIVRLKWNGINKPDNFDNINSSELCNRFEQSFSPVH